MYRVCVYDSKAAEDALFIKEIVIDERGEVQEISESQNFNDYYARISEKEKERPDILVTELNHNAQELQLIEQMWKMNPDLQTVYVMDKSHVLTKPVSQSSVVECVNRRMIEDSHMISFRSKRKMLAVNAREVSHVESRKHNVLIYQDGIPHKFRMKMDECLAQMPDFFIRIHQSYAVNFYYIDSFQRGGVILQSGNRILMSRKYYAQAKKRYEELFLEQAKRKKAR